MRFESPGRSLAVLALALGLALVPGIARAEDPPAAKEPAAEEVHVPWVRDWEEAKKQAAETNRDLLVNFTGSDWCIFCKRLEGEVFSHKAFVEEECRHFVFVFLDFPNAEDLKAKVVDPALNERLSNEYGVGGYPTVMLTTPSGLPYARTGYRPGGPEPYVEHLAELRAHSAVINELAKAGDKPTDDLVKRAFAVIDEQGLMDYTGYAGVLDRALRLDPDGKLGFQAKILGHRELLALKELLPKVRGVEPDWERLFTQICSSNHMAGKDYAGIAYHCIKKFLDVGRPADAKLLIEKVTGDEELMQDPQAAKIFADLKAKAEAAIEAGKAAPKEEAPKAPAK